MITVDLVAGARPNFMKIAPLYDVLSKSEKFEPRFVYTGQHVEPVMSRTLFRPLGLPPPDVKLGSNKSPGVSYALEMMAGYSNWLASSPPDLVLVPGDTDSSFASAYAAKSLGFLVVHVEAALRSWEDSKEENNRAMIDGISDLLLIPFDDVAGNVEHLRGKVVTVGNIMLDAMQMVRCSPWYKRLKVEKSDVLVTMHRPANVDEQWRLSHIIEELDKLAEKSVVRFPVHPRTWHSMQKFQIAWRKYMIKPRPYPRFLKMMENSKVVLTDSGGLQSEAAFFNIPCILVRTTTGWTNLVRAGCVELVEPSIISYAVSSKLWRSHRGIENPLTIKMWDGKTRFRVLQALAKFMGVKDG